MKNLENCLVITFDPDILGLEASLKDQSENM